MGDDVTRTVAAAAGRIGHVQIADFPGRHEPGSGQIDIDALVTALTAARYDGGLALEYVPTRPSAESLRAVAARYPLFDPAKEPTR